MHKQSSEINVKTLEVAQSKLMILESKIGLLKKSLYMLNDLRNESQRHELKRDKHQAMIACLSLENAQNVIDMGNLKRFLTQGIIVTFLFNAREYKWKFWTT